MILRVRQKEFVEKSVKALLERGNTLGVAPTGSGKTIMLSAVVGQMLNGSGEKACVLGHRDEITAQNMAKFKKVNPHLDVSVVNASEKSWKGNAVFAMVQTLARKKNLDDIPSLKILVVDEAHHAHADTYKRIIAAARERNPLLHLFGVTATPNRGDGKTLRDVFDNCADQITLREMIAAGHLVVPRTFVIDLGVNEELSRVDMDGDEYDMDEVEEIMDTRPLTEEVIKHWKDKAGGRRSVVFCSTVKHAEHVTECFREAGVATELVTGKTPDQERECIFNRLDTGETQVLVNVAVATEGWDCPPVSCVVLLRPCSRKSTMIQMIGRGLRKVDPAIHPGVEKSDCVVLDFGISALKHGTIEQDINLRENKVAAPSEESAVAIIEPPTKVCPECHASIHKRMMECPFCGYAFMGIPGESINDFRMTEIDLLGRSSFQWCDINRDGTSLVATGFNAWAGVFLRDGLWRAVGGTSEEWPRVIYTGDRTACLASADDWMNANETEEAAHKSRRWLHYPPTAKQLSYLYQHQAMNTPMTRYEASCALSFYFNQNRINRVLRAADLRRAFQPALTTAGARA
ncbi:MAG: UvrABC system protein B [Elusimicrobia bacterium]|nr:UvrABC system protein B [Elusimicrobiota bacterium]